ncbi:MAG: hypothetical protein CL587_01125 [Alteromonadaceae bacterium]|nr:hypothetical protein [Alteromonadaceae bacterium]
MHDDIPYLYLLSEVCAPLNVYDFLRHLRDLSGEKKDGGKKTQSKFSLIIVALHQFVYLSNDLR